jgi:hypothetical protein
MTGNWVAADHVHGDAAMEPTENRPGDELSGGPEVVVAHTAMEPTRDRPDNGPVLFDLDPERHAAMEPTVERPDGWRSPPK